MFPVSANAATPDVRRACLIQMPGWIAQSIIRKKKKSDFFIFKIKTTVLIFIIIKRCFIIKEGREGGEQWSSGTHQA